jgi:hypothetical protein
MRTLVCLIAVFLPAAAVAQNPQKPQPAHKLLAVEAGTWDCDVKMFKGQKPLEYKGVEVNELVGGGLYLKTSFTFKMGDQSRFEGHALMGYDPRAKKYVGTWVDNFTTVPRRIEADYDMPTRTLTDRSPVADERGNDIKTKQITTWSSDSQKKMEIFMLIEAAGKETEVKLMEIAATKRTGTK